LNWFVYIILCTDNSLYTGITTNIERRFAEHQVGKGARYFRGHTPVRVVYLEVGHSRSSASKREAQIKGLQADDKHKLIVSAMDQLDSLA